MPAAIIGVIVMDVIAASKINIGNNPPWNVTRNAFCYPNQVPVTWSGTFEDCWKTCMNTKGCKQFSFTNSQWKGATGCSLVKPCASFCTTGACRNWDTFDCPEGAMSCQQPVSPAPAPVQGRFLSGIFASHMVLQRDVPSLLSGSNVHPGDVVTVTVTGAAGAETVTHNVTVAAEWSVQLKPRPAVAAPSNITIISGTQRVVLVDVLWGDVWGCHGQSNMAFGLGQDISASSECPLTATYPHIRHVTVGPGPSSQSVWQVPSPSTTCTGKGFSPFSAVCWYFGKNLFDSLAGKVPVGLVGSFVGGTAVERWSGPDALTHCNQTGVVMQSGLWDSYIVQPGLLGLQMSGWVWYQGESNVACSTRWKWMPGLNCGIGCSRAHPVCNASQTACASYYGCQFPAMITDWRDKFIDGDTAIAGRPRPFLFVELAPYTEGVGEPFDKSVSLIRGAQLEALSLPHVAMAAAYDYGDPFSPLGNIHPEYKAPVGARLAMAARALTYHENVPYKNPLLRSTTLTTTNRSHPLLTTTPLTTTNRSHTQTLTLTFDEEVEIVRPVMWGGCPAQIPPESCAWLSINGVNVTARNGDHGTIEVDVPPALLGMKEDECDGDGDGDGDDGCGGGDYEVRTLQIEYLQGDWPVPFIYASGLAEGSVTLPAAPFSTTVNQL